MSRDGEVDHIPTGTTKANAHSSLTKPVDMMDNFPYTNNKTGHFYFGFTKNGGGLDRGQAGCYVLVAA